MASAASTTSVGSSPTPRASVPAATSTRDEAVDWLRGLVMVLMVLDHARDFWHGLRARPLDLGHTTWQLFATRWVTHFCAPTFVLLAGVAAYLYGCKRSAAQRTRFLLTRGLFLVLLELTLVRLLWVPDPFYHFTLLQVIWVLGWCMVVLAALAYLPRALVAACGALLVVGHNALDSVHAQSFGALAPLWNVLHERAVLTLAPGRVVFVSYPLVPWLGVMALGYALGPVLQLPPAERRRWLLRAGGALGVAFVAVRGVNLYGDPQPWSAQSRPLFTLLSFLNCEKYPPSLSFLLMTLGPALLLLAFAPGLSLRWGSRALTVFGKVPLLFYVLHLFVLRCAAIPTAWLRFGPLAFAPPPRGTAGSPELPLVVAYLAWLVTLALLYPVCRWYARLKSGKQHAWLSYL